MAEVPSMFVLDGNGDLVEIATATAVVAKLIAAPATEGKQDTTIVALAEILDKIIASPATEATLASVLAKIIAAPATEAKQDTLIAKDFATQTTLAAILAKIIAAPATEATLAAVLAAVAASNGAEYETIAASQTAQVLGATGATNDLIIGLLVIPATTSPGNVLLLDNATSITLFAGGASSVSNLVPFFIPLGQGIRSVSGAWKVTTGANVSVVAVGNFT